MATLSTLRSELANRLQDAGAEPLWTDAQKNRFINGAIRRANEGGARRLVSDESVAIVSAQQEYTMPAAVPSAASVYQIDVVTTEAVIPTQAWLSYETTTYTAGVESHAVKVVFLRARSETGSLRVHYLAKYPELSADADECVLPQEYTLAYAAFLAHSETRATDDADRKYHTEEAQKWLQIGEAKLKELLRAQPVIAGRAVGAV